MQAQGLYVSLVIPVYIPLLLCSFSSARYVFSLFLRYMRFSNYKWLRFDCDRKKEKQEVHKTRKGCVKKGNRQGEKKRLREKWNSGWCWCLLYLHKKSTDLQTKTNITSSGTYKTQENSCFPTDFHFLLVILTSLALRSFQPTNTLSMHYLKNFALHQTIFCTIFISTTATTKPSSFPNNVSRPFTFSFVMSENGVV